MQFDLAHVLLVLSAVLAGGIAALKIIAPMTATDVDDSILERLEQVEGILADLHLGAKPEDAPQAAPQK